VELDWIPVDFYSVMLATQQKLGTKQTSLDLDFTCHLMLITSFSNGDITNLWNVSQLPATPNYSNKFLCIILASQSSSEILCNNMQY
jgi:hypothetical protein